MRELSIKDEQKILLELLKKIDSLCKKVGVRYFIAYGTLLGAARNNSFIEWDDDIDIWMFRKDYFRFKKEFEKSDLKNDYFLQDYESDPYIVTPELARVCVNGTFKWPKECMKEKFHTGMCLDIFFLDYGYGDNRDDRDLRIIKKCHHLLYASHRGYGKGTIKAKCLHLICRAIPRHFFSRIILGVENRHKECISDTVLCYTEDDIVPKFPSRFFEESVDLKFEDGVFEAPACYKEFLAMEYGEDYMIPRQTKDFSRKVAYEL